LLELTNDGEGIAPAHLDRVFNRFFRADPGKSREAGGSGLGLAIVRSIAAAHRGTASVPSEPGRTTFTLTFSGEANASLPGVVDVPAPRQGRAGFS
jgi:signal transduction histidine kinase